MDAQRVLKAQDLLIPESFESRDRRERPFEIRLKEEMEYLDNNDQQDYLIFKMIPNNIAVNPKLKNANKKKSKRGVYSPVAPTVKVIRLYETGTTSEYLMKLQTRGGQLVHSNISDKAKAESGKDDRLKSILMWVSTMGKITTVQTPIESDKALEEKLRAKIEKEVRAKLAQEAKAN
jgi:hypothetical protein